MPKANGNGAVTTQGEPLEPLFEGGPKGPIEGRHQDFHWLSWAFHCVRFRRLDDRHHDPWMGKHLKSCQRVMKLARGDMGEVKRRMVHLWLWYEVNPDFWRVTPECLLQRWDDLHAPPSDAVGGRKAMRRQVNEHAVDQRLRELEGR